MANSGLVKRDLLSLKEARDVLRRIFSKLDPEKLTPEVRAEIDALRIKFSI